MAQAKKTAAKAPAEAKTTEKLKDETKPADDPGTPSTQALKEQETPADENVEPAAVPTQAGEGVVTNNIHGNDYEVTTDRGYRLKK